MKISKIRKLESVKTIFYHILTNFGGSRPKTQGEDRFLVIFQKSHLKLRFSVGTLINLEFEN